MHVRTPTPIDQQKVVRMNRDTLYSDAVFDLDAGPVTITLPDPGKRFMSMQVINEDQYTLMVVYSKGAYTLTKDKVGTRYVATSFASSPIPTASRTSTKFTNCRTPSRSARKVPAPSRFPYGIKPARTRFVKPWSRSAPPHRISMAPSETKSRSIPSCLSSALPLAGEATQTKKPNT